jgi:HAD superfamily hydrolase (TIGR01484 family)
MSYQLVLATDLDGTFLEGDMQAKQFFYNKLLQLQSEVLLIYVTGRPVGTVKSFCELGFLPYPHFVLGDHGTHIAEGKSFAPIPHLQEAIAFSWNQGNQTLRDLLSGEPGIQLQPIDPPYRVAYYYDPDRLQRETLEKITRAGFDFILSSDAYLDILPKGVNKGSSLLKLLDYLTISHDLVITSGDSLNDLPLFQTGLKSIAVGNSEPKLVEIIKGLKNVYHSGLPGLLGIIDGLQHYGCFSLFSRKEAGLPSL